MRLTIFLFTLSSLLFFSVPSFSQKELVVKSLKKHKKRYFKEGNRFLFMTVQNPEYKKGQIEKINDSSIVFFFPEAMEDSTKEISLDSITLIRKPTRFQYITYGLGTLFMLNGTFFILEGPAVTSTPLLNRGIGVVSFAFGLIPFMLQPKTYDIGEHYTLHVKETKPEIKKNPIPEEKETAF